MKNILFLIIALVGSTFAYAQKTQKSYYPAYLINTNTVERVATEQQLKTKSIAVQTLLLDYPVLEDLSTFSSKEKYGVINASLVTSIDDDNPKYKIFHLTNGQEYKVKKSKQSNQSIALFR